jgi:hypothetical protein
MRPIRKCANRGLTKVSDPFTLKEMPPSPLVDSLHYNVHALIGVLVRAYGPQLKDTGIIFASVAYALGEAASLGTPEQQSMMMEVITRNVSAGFKHGPGNSEVKEG